MMEIPQSILPLAFGMIAAGVAGGLLSGLLGVGGGIVVVPVLYTVFEVLGVAEEIRMHLAVGTSFAAMIPTTLASARSHYKKGAVDFDIFRMWAPMAFAGCIFGVFVAGRTESVVLVWVFAISAIAVAVYMLLSHRAPDPVDRMPGYTGGAIGGGTVGTVSAMMGIGGGTFFVPLFTALGTPVHRAVGTSAALGIVISIPGFLGYILAGWEVRALPDLSFGFVNLLGAMLVMPVSSFCAPYGVKIAHRLTPAALKLCFGLFLSATAARMIYSTL